MRLEDIRIAFRVDGSLRDVYVNDTSVADWEIFWNLAISLKAMLFCDGAPCKLPKKAQQLLDDREHTYNLAITLGDVVANCHFFCSDEIELDIDPKAMLSQRELDSLLKFLSNLGNCLDKDVTLTEENSPDAVWIRYVAQNKELIFTPLHRHLDYQN